MTVAIVVSDCSYPPREGLHQQTILMLQALQAQGVDFHLFGYCKYPASLDRELLERDTGIRFHSEPIVNPGASLMVGWRNRILGGVLCGPNERSLIERFNRGDYDLIHLEGAAACGLYRDHLAARTILGFIDPGSLRRWRFFRSTRSPFRKLQQGVLALAHYAFERSLDHHAVVWHVVSEADRDYFLQRHHRAKTVCIPVIFPDATGTLDSSDRESEGYGSETFDKTPPRVVVFGNLRLPHMYAAFVDLLEQVIGPVAVDGVSFSLDVLGRIPIDDFLVTRCAGFEARFHEWVEDYQSFLSGCDVAILPDTIGSGLKNRTIQCMGLGLAVLGTPTAFEGIPVVSGQHAVIASDPAAMSTALAQLCQSQARRITLARNGRNLVVSHYGATAVGATWKSLYQGIAGVQVSKNARAL